ncbi:hypothetical protein [Wolbachia pipientis]|nr:hypothetical protein [Wolbachia pipientis]
MFNSKMLAKPERIELAVCKQGTAEYKLTDKGGQILEEMKKEMASDFPKFLFTEDVSCEPVAQKQQEK